MRFNGFLISPFLVGNDQHSKLFTPVSQMVDLDRLIADLLENMWQAISDNRWTQVPNREWFCDIRTRHVDNDIFLLANGLVGIVLFFSDNIL